MGGTRHQLDTPFAPYTVIMQEDLALDPIEAGEGLLVSFVGYLDGKVKGRRRPCSI